MPNSSFSRHTQEPISLDLRNPLWAGFLAWILPGLGHFYQKRYHKALIFFLCIVPMFITGCALASHPNIGIARNVYWSWRQGDIRLWWLAQAPLGMATIPSWMQAMRINNGNHPLFGRFMTPPKRYQADQLGCLPEINEVRQKLPYYELGTYLTVIAGLLNLLVILDAMDGPFVGGRKEIEEKPNMES